ncbi:MAG: sigma 54-interacting transcriptional regulator [Phycisphaerae bacterium]|nr:sigma 54-interacting transcriptional regulator [Phycisphaerae bacterium]
MKKNNMMILDHFPEGIIVHDTHRTISCFNQAAEKITGRSRHDVIGRDCHEIFPSGFCGGLCSFCDDERQKNIEKNDYPLHILTKDGTAKDVEMAVIAITNDLGNIQGVLGCFRDVTEVKHLRRNLKKIQSFHGIIGSDEKMQAVYDLVSDLANSDFPVLILGESGTGKELVAGAIHGEGRRAGRPFVPVNCGALPEGILESELFGHVRGAFTGAVRDKKGRFELADTGTIFLDEVGELSPMMQVKLLRVLQENTFERVGGEKPIHVDVRVLSATNRDLRKMVEKGEFREDLYYRLCVVPITLPPIRERRNDIPMLINFFIERFRKDTERNIKGVSDEALGKMLDYHWPGNVRELQNAIQYAYVKCKNNILQCEHLPPEIIGTIHPPKKTRRQRRRKLSAQQVINALEATGGNKLKAAQLLGVGRATLHRFLKEQPTDKKNKKQSTEFFEI